jgi:TatD DNase family protein
MKLFDAHCHMQDSRFAADLAGALQRALDAGVTRMLCCGTAENDWRQVAGLCSRHSALVPAFGLHPWYVRGRSSTWMSALTDLVVSEPAAVVGEIGLDHAIRERNDVEQADAFVAQLRLAKALERPACVHCRKAWEAVLHILNDLGGLPSGFMLHSYSGPVEMVAPLAEMGAYFSFSGTITRHRNERGHAAAAAVPLDRLLIETDAPDLMPTGACPAADGSPPQAERPNEPANLVHVLRKVAELRNMPEETLADSTWENACRLLLVGHEQAGNR